MSEEELAAIRARHWKVGGRGTAYPEQCVCGLAWPCDAGRLVAEVERLQEGLRAILREHRAVRTPVRPYCCICAPQEGEWPCTTVLEAGAALGGEE